MTFEIFINQDPTLRYFLRETKIDYDRVEWQVKVKITVAKLAFWKYLEHKYPTIK